MSDEDAIHEETPLFNEAKRKALETFERDYFTRLHAMSEGNVSAMSRASGLERTHVRYYLARHGIGREAQPQRERGTRKALAELRAILRPVDGESLAQAAERVAAAATSKRKRKGKSNV